MTACTVTGDHRDAARRRLDALLAGDPAADVGREPLPPWMDERDDGYAPDRVPGRADPAAWDEPPWWRRVRWAPDRLGGIAVLVVVIALGGVAAFDLGTTPSDPAGVVAPPLPEVSPSSSVAPPAAADPLVVSVVGMVTRSGLVTLAPGARIADALDAAGGTLGDADRDGLNLAQRVADGQQVLVGVRPGAGPGARSGVVGPAGAPATGPGAPAPAPAGVAPAGVDLNTADATALDALPGVGPATAAAILSWRVAHGRFASVDQLAEVDGIGPATLAKLRPLVRV